MPYEDHVGPGERAVHRMLVEIGAVEENPQSEAMIGNALGTLLGMELGLMFAVALPRETATLAGLLREENQIVYKSLIGDLAEVAPRIMRDLGVPPEGRG